MERRGYLKSREERLGRTFRSRLQGNGAGKGGEQRGQDQGPERRLIEDLKFPNKCVTAEPRYRNTCRNVPPP
jgi:hypothetical protein